MEQFKLLTEKSLENKQSAENQQPNYLSRVDSNTLEGHVRTVWQRNVRHKLKVSDRLIKCLRARKGEYSPSQIAEIGQYGGSKPIYLKLTGTKSRAASAWIRDVLMPNGEKPFMFDPTTIPDLPIPMENAVREEARKQAEELVANGMINDVLDAVEFFENTRDKAKATLYKEAVERSKRMEKKIADMMDEGDWDKSFEEFIEDFATYPTAFIKGPFIRKTRTLNWGEEFQPKVTDEIALGWARVSPFDVYPSPYTDSLQRGDFIEHIRFTKADLYNLIGIDGYNETEVRKVLVEYDNGGLQEWIWEDFERNQLESDSDWFQSDASTIDAIHFWGTVSGTLLSQWNVDVEKEKQYPVDIIVIGNYVIRAELNDDPLGMRPYHHASWDSVPGSLWGIALPEQMEDHQSMVNAAARAMANNMALSSGPQTIVYTDMMAEGESIRSIHPFKIWQAKTPMVNPGYAIKPVEFFQPPNNVDALLAVLDAFERRSDDVTNVPRYSYGNERIGGAGNALANYELVCTPEGFKPIGELEVGSRILNTYGGVSSVEGVYPQGVSNIIRLQFSNGSQVDCDLNHRWNVRTHHNRPFQTLTTEEILAKGLFRTTKIDERNPSGFRPKWMLPLIEDVEYDTREVMIDPYTMGALIGDGDSRCRLTSMDEEVFTRIPYSLGTPDHTGKAITRTVKGIKQHYHAYGLDCLSMNKFIPDDYLFNSTETRIALLQGLMDTDGCVTKSGQTFFSSSSYELIKDFRQLVASLGGVVGKICEEDGGEFEIRHKICSRQTNYRLTFNLPHYDVCSIKRKLSRIKNTERTHTYIVGAESIGYYPATCITVDSKDELFLTEHFIPTHNTATGLSMLMNSAAKGIRRAISNIDSNIIRPSIYQAFVHVMLHDDDTSLKGDCKIVPRGAASLLIKEQNLVRLQTFLNQTSNPIDMSIIGMKGRAGLLREIGKLMDLPIEGIIPSDEDVAIMEQQQQMQQQQMPPDQGGPVPLKETPDLTLTPDAGMQSTGNQEQMLQNRLEGQLKRMGAPQ